jgi:hypothetical protein
MLATDDITSLPGWKVLSDGIDYVDSSYWAASAGSRSVDLSALTSGGIMQRIDGFTAGYHYQIKFDLSADPFDAAARPKDKRAVVSITGGGPRLFSYSLTDANTPTTMGYQTYTYDFIASGTSQNLQFRSLVNDEYGVVLDNVSISVVPESSTWLMMIGGLGLIGFAARRTRQARSVAA